MAQPLYVYLCYGRSPAAERELRYSLETLRAEFPAADIVIYTDRPAAFADLGAVVIDAAPFIREAFAHAYRHRLKPIVLGDALRRFARPARCSTSTVLRARDSAAAVARALEQGAAMNQFVRRDPYPDFPAFETDLPTLGRYRPSRDAVMLNSGLLAATPAHLPLIDDAIALIDRLWAGGLHKHDIEQFALAETLRLGGVKIALIDDVFEHYCARWARRYMRRRLRRRQPGGRIPYSKARVRLFKASWTLRLAMRKARQLTRARWRTT